MAIAAQTNYKKDFASAAKQYSQNLAWFRFERIAL
jgi:hypothetical protein